MKIIQFDNGFNRTYLKENEGVIYKLINKAKKFKDYDYIKPKEYSSYFPYSYSYFAYSNEYEGQYAYFFLRNKIFQNNIDLLKIIKKRFSKKLNNFKLL